MFYLTATAFAQNPSPADVASLPELRAGPVGAGPAVRGNISAGDAPAGERRRDDYRLRLAENEVVQVDMESAEFDTLLEIWRPGDSQPLATNDDLRIGSTNSRLIFSAPGPGDYVVRAQDFFEGRGAYTLTVVGLAAPGEAGPLAEGSTPGILDRTSAVQADPDRPGRGFRYRPYRFMGTPGTRVRLDMISSDVNASLQLLGPDGAVIDTDDDGGRFRNARIVADIEREGVYIVRARAPEQQTGDYTVELHVSRPVPDSPPTVLQVGSRSDGELNERSPVRLRRGERGRIDFFYELYRVNLRQGQTVTLTVDSTDFDPILEAGTVFPPLGFATAERNDDGGAGRNARLILQPLRPGWVVLRVRAFGSGSGRFTIGVAAGEPPSRN